jgi:predicted phage tail protein
VIDGNTRADGERFRVRRRALIVVIQVRIQTADDPAQIALAADCPAGLQRQLQRGNQQGRQDGNDGHHDKELDEREASAMGLCGHYEVVILLVQAR